MKPHEIKSLLWKHNIKQIDLARMLGRPISQISNVINGWCVSHPIAGVIANCIGKDIYDVFPNYRRTVSKKESEIKQKIA